MSCRVSTTPSKPWPSGAGIGSTISRTTRQEASRRTSRQEVGSGRVRCARQSATGSGGVGSSSATPRRDSQPAQSRPRASSSVQPVIATAAGLRLRSRPRASMPITASPMHSSIAAVRWCSAASCSARRLRVTSSSTASDRRKRPCASRSLVADSSTSTGRPSRASMRYSTSRHSPVRRNCGSTCSMARRRESASRKSVEGRPMTSRSS